LAAGPGCALTGTMSVPSHAELGFHPIGKSQPRAYRDGMDGWLANPGLFEAKPLAKGTTGQVDAIMKHVENIFAVTLAANKNEK
jgi:hypothetical protein